MTHLWLTNFHLAVVYSNLLKTLMSLPPFSAKLLKSKFENLRVDRNVLATNVSVNTVCIHPVMLNEPLLSCSTVF